MGETVTFESPCLIKNDLTLLPGSTAVFKSDSTTYVRGYTTISATIILDLGKNADDGLFYKLVSDKMTSMSLISGAGGFQVSSTRLQIAYTGGCTTITGSLNLFDSSSTDYPTKLVVSHLKKRGTGNCHWVWSTISGLAAVATLIIVPLIEKYAWKLYD